MIHNRDSSISIFTMLVVFVCVAIGTTGCAPAKPAFEPLPTHPPATSKPPGELPTLGPSSTPEPPTETPLPTQQVAEAAPEGWIKFESTGVELWLPGSWVGGDMVNRRNQSINAVRNLGSTYSMVYESMSQADPSFVLWMVDKNLALDFSIPTVLVATETAPNTDLDTYATQAINSGNLFVSEQKKLTLLGLDTRRLMVQTKLYAHDFSAWIFIVQDGERFWIIFYEAGIETFFNMQSIFEQSIKTFNIK